MEASFALLNSKRVPEHATRDAFPQIYLSWAPFFLVALPSYSTIQKTLIMIPSWKQPIHLSVSKSRAMLFCGLLILAGISPLFTHFQFITGSLVNAVLFTAAMTLGPLEAVMIGLVPSTVALASGTLPLPLAPMVPFIIISNAVLISVFHITKKAGVLPAIVTASIVKFLFLSVMAKMILDTLLASELASKLGMMLSWPQLATALIGGVLAYILNKKITRI